MENLNEQELRETNGGASIISDKNGNGCMHLPGAGGIHIGPWMPRIPGTILQRF